MYAIYVLSSIEYYYSCCNILIVSYFYIYRSIIKTELRFLKHSSKTHLPWLRNPNYLNYTNQLTYIFGIRNAKYLFVVIAKFTFIPGIMKKNSQFRKDGKDVMLW